MTQHRGRVLEVCALSAWCVLGACRFERDPHSPFAADAGLAGLGSSEATSGGGGNLTAGTSGSASGLSAGATSGAGASGTTAGKGVTGGTGGADATGGRSAGAGAGAGGMAGNAIEDAAATSPDAGDVACSPPDVAECNPVTNQGCPASMQCAVEALSSVLAGYCIFSAPMDAGFCFNSGVTESCPPQQTCVVDQCRTLCFCDTDCEEGECCVEPVGTLGFKVCGAC